MSEFVAVSDSRRDAEREGNARAAGEGGGHLRENKAIQVVLRQHFGAQEMILGACEREEGGEEMLRAFRKSCCAFSEVAGGEIGLGVNITFGLKNEKSAA